MFPEFCRFFSGPHRRLRQALGSDELRFFLLAVALSSAIVFFNVLPLYESAGHALRDTLFQVSSVVSTTGFSTADFALWPTVSQFVLVLLMFLGGCAGQHRPAVSKPPGCCCCSAAPAAPSAGSPIPGR